MSTPKPASWLLPTAAVLSANVFVATESAALSLVLVVGVSTGSVSCFSVTSAAMSIGPVSPGLCKVARSAGIASHQFGRDRDR